MPLRVDSSREIENHSSPKQQNSAQILVKSIYTRAEKNPLNIAPGNKNHFRINSH